jgi:transglutaminase-like putative cysteine protease
MIVEIPELAAGREAKAIVTYELERSAILAPQTTDDLQLPSKSDHDLRIFLRPSPYIESRNTSIVRLMRETTKDVEGWSKVEAIYDAVRQRVEYRNGELKGAARALADGWGGLRGTHLFVYCDGKSRGIPARTVWVEGH